MGIFGVTELFSLLLCIFENVHNIKEQDAQDGELHRDKDTTLSTYLQST